MLYAFTDESYNSTYYLQGAYVVDRALLPDLSRIAIETLEFAQHFGISANAELRGYSIMNSKHGWEPLRGKIQARIAIYKFFLTRIGALEGRIFIEGIDTLSADLETTFNLSRHLKTQKLLHSKLNAYSKERTDFTIVIADEITTSSVLKTDFQVNKSEYPRLASFVHLQSVSNPGIQIIDLILYIYQRAHVGPKLGTSHFHALELWKIIEHLLSR